MRMMVMIIYLLFLICMIVYYGKMMYRNYQKELETVIQKEQKEGRTPKLLLHSCCAPCSSYVLEYLSPFLLPGDD